MADRSNRESATREKQERKVDWKPPSTLDAPESRGGTVETKAHGLLAKKFVQDFLKVGTTCTLRTLDKGKFGRYLGDFKVYDKWLCKELVDNFLAVPYSGQSKDTIAMLHEANRQKLIKQGLL